nr:hypothetical protein [Tanacetum cinerariifolium]
MSTQQDIYAAVSKNRPPKLNKDNYVSWSSRIIKYTRSRPNGKMIVDSIKNGTYVRLMIATLGEPDLPVPVPESFHEQMNEELTENDVKRMDADDQAIQTILLGLPKDFYAAVDSFETAKEIWERVRKMIKGSDIGEQEKKAKLFNEWEKFTCTDEESIESYYHRFMQLMNDLKRKKHFPENIASNLKIDKFRMLEEMMGISLDSTLDKWHRISKGIMHGRMHASTSRTHLDKAPIYDTDGSAEVHLNDNYYNNKIFNMFTQAEQYTDVLEPIPETQLVPQNDNYVTSVAPSMVQSGEDKFHDKEVDLDAKIKDLENILLKMDKTVQTMHMLNQQHDPPAMYDSEETLELAHESLEKMRFLK